jgi:hypothetical protein
MNNLFIELARLQSTPVPRACPHLPPMLQRMYCHRGINHNTHGPTPAPEPFGATFQSGQRGESSEIARRLSGAK